jgi:hypothetical protein
MATEDINKFIWEKWSNYSRGLAISYSFRKNKDLTIMDVKDAFSSGVWEFVQLLRQNDINIENLKWKE